MGGSCTAAVWHVGMAPQPWYKLDSTTAALPHECTSAPTRRDQHQPGRTGAARTVTACHPDQRGIPRDGQHVDGQHVCRDGGAVAQRHQQCDTSASRAQHQSAHAASVGGVAWRRRAVGPAHRRQLLRGVQDAGQPRVAVHHDGVVGGSRQEDHRRQAGRLRQAAGRGPDSRHSARQLPLQLCLLLRPPQCALVRGPWQLEALQVPGRPLQWPCQQPSPGQKRRSRRKKHQKSANTFRSEQTLPAAPSCKHAAARPSKRASWRHHHVANTVQNPPGRRQCQHRCRRYRRCTQTARRAPSAPQALRCRRSTCPAAGGSVLRRQAAPLRRGETRTRARELRPWKALPHLLLPTSHWQAPAQANTQDAVKGFEAGWARSAQPTGGGCGSTACRSRLHKGTRRPGTPSPNPKMTSTSFPRCQQAGRAFRLEKQGGKGPDSASPAKAAASHLIGAPHRPIGTW